MCLFLQSSHTLYKHELSFECIIQFVRFRYKKSTRTQKKAALTYSGVFKAPQISCLQQFKNNKHPFLFAVLAHQPKFEAILSEVEMVSNELYYAITNLSSWMKPEYVSKNLVGVTVIY